MVIKPRYAYTYLVKGRAYLELELHDFQAAIDNCDRALDLNHNFFEAYFIRDTAHYYSGDDQNALFNFYTKSNT